MAKGPIPGWGDARQAAGGPENSAPETSAGAETPPGAPGSQAAGTAADTPVKNVDLQDRILGDFRILRRLGRGGMAEVYLAEQTQLKRNVAIKVLYKDRVADATYLKRFQTEAMAAGSLNHPNIVQVLTIGDQDGIQYIAQEYVPGMNLREYLARKGPPELAFAVRVIRQVASALQAAHNAGIVHRDIKPENIMLTRKGEVKVADFGLAQLTQEGERVNLTQDGITMGTPLYMSPEQVKGSKVDLRTDIYSLGVTCYHMLSGAPPFRGETAISIAVQHLKQDPEPLEKIRGDLPPLLCRIVQKMMAKDPEKRYQSAQAIAKDLKRVTAGDDQDDHPASEAEIKVAESTGKRGNLIIRALGGLWRAPDWPVARQIYTVLGLAVVVGGAAAGIGWVTRVANPLEAPLPRSAGVEKKDKAASQYFYALNLKDSIEAWRAVIDFPEDQHNRLFRKYAKQHLAELLLVKRRNDEARALFDELAAESDPHFRASGIAGQAVLLNLQGDYRVSQQLLNKLQSPTNSGAPAAAEGRKPQILFDLLDDKMRLAVTETIHRNVEQLNSEMSKEWEDIFRKQDHAEGAPAVTTDGSK
jgi:serine/threonine-protein kinase